jgi:hypothetical protein
MHWKENIPMPFESLGGNIFFPHRKSARTQDPKENNATTSMNERYKKTSRMPYGAFKKYWVFLDFWVLFFGSR